MHKVYINPPENKIPEYRDLQLVKLVSIFCQLKIRRGGKMSKNCLSVTEFKIRKK